MPRQGGGLISKVVGGAVGITAEYREHRKEQKANRISRENSEQSLNSGAASASSSQPVSRTVSSTSGLPTYESVAGEKSDRSLASGKPASDDKKLAQAQYDSSDSDERSIEDDEEVWELDEAISRSESAGLPSYEESETAYANPDELVHEVIEKNRALAPSPSQPFVRQPLPYPVILPQRRPGKKTRGFVRAYAPLLGECSGISQDAFLTFLENFYKSSQASPIFPIIQVAAGIAGFAPGLIAFAVTTAVQIAAQVGQEMQERQRTNTFLDKMNNEFFKPAGLYALIIKYKSQAQIDASGNSLLARFGIAGEKVNLSTNQTIAKYDPQLSTGDGSKSLSARMQEFRLGSSKTQGAHNLPEAAPLIFPDIDDALAREGPTNFKERMKDGQNFLASYMDKKAQAKYAKDDPYSNLNVPDDQRQFKSKLSDPNHPMYSGGLIALASGGALARNRSNEQGYDRRDQRRMDKYDRKMDRYERSGNDRRMEKMERRMERRGYDPYARRGYYDDGYDRGYGTGYDSYGRGGGLGGRRSGGGPLGLVGGLVGAAMNGGQSSQERPREYEDAYGSSGKRPMYDSGDPRMRRSFDDRNRGPAPYGGQSDDYGRSNPPAPYGGQKEDYDYGGNSNAPAPYGGAYDYQYGGNRPSPYGRGSSYNSGRQGRQKKGGLLGGVKKLMKEDVLYLLIVNLPSEEELAEAREMLAAAKAK